ncbi:DNA N-6-adenine-methyltransferase [Carpediemonas membranifera]|uniref:DNA N-6-adenine-methyltransferase n=1 Tax=Carpediemonas membranifera TaxID=201153 RepID=A0A8J6E3Q3_9EUKA|nr:DNA N-6-adenine-methyltransferase [Carpediemonas membranifera]|eukprot:KAG9393487.1 DNA N-6-adenine-methyltransferase [Carpediemonas membranifera]
MGRSSPPQGDPPAKSQGRFPPHLMAESIMVKELYALERAVRVTPGRNQQVSLFTDNTAVMAWVNRQGSTRAPKAAFPILKRLFDCCLSRGLSVRAFHVAGHLNVTADRLSRFAKLEWATPRSVLERMQDRWGPAQIDAAAAPDKTLQLPGYAETFWTREDNGLNRSWTGARIFKAPPWALIAHVLSKLRKIAAPSRRHPRQLRSCVFLIVPNITAAEVMELKRLTQWKMYFRVPVEQFRTRELEKLQREGKIDLAALAQHKRSIAGYITAFKHFVENNVIDGDDGDVLLAFLTEEAMFVSPDTLSLKSHWIQKLAPLFCTWTRPAQADRITKEAQRHATTEHMTGGATPIRRKELQKALQGFNTSDEIRRQWCPFGVMCYVTISRGKEIYDRTRADISRSGRDLVIRIKRTKTNMTLQELAFPASPHVLLKFL